MTAIPAHVERMEVEFTELGNKALALDLFIRTNPVFTRLQPMDAWLLKRQLDHMIDYLAILDTRIRRAKDGL